MLRRIGSAFGLAGALLLLATTSLPARETLDSSLDVKARQGAYRIDPGHGVPTNGATQPGDDDTPNRDGSFKDQPLPMGDDGVQGELRKTVATRDIVTRLHVHWY